MPALEFIFSRLDPFGEATGMLRVPQRLLHGTARDIRRATLEPLFLVLDEIAHTHNKTIAQVALNWLLSADPCVIPIPGAKNARQASENAGALGWRLSEEEHARLSASEVATRFR
jgi:aryl-alcohol dehydrogenase-like predicted oxidoreductase